MGFEGMKQGLSKARVRAYITKEGSMDFTLAMGASAGPAPQPAVTASPVAPTAAAPPPVPEPATAQPSDIKVLELAIQRSTVCLEDIGEKFQNMMGNSLNLSRQLDEI